MINWSKINYRSKLGKALRLPTKLLPGSMVMPVISGPIKGMKWRVGASDHGCWLGTYELSKMLTMKSFLKPGMTVYDVGANAGIYSLLFAQAVGPAGKVFAFEPFGENIVNFLYHIRLNGLRNVVLIQAALAGSHGISSFHVSEIGNSMGQLTSGETELRIPTLALDELIADVAAPPDLIKMDVEGAESEVLSGASALLKGKRPIWFIALHGDEQKRLCQDILSSHGYRIFSLDGKPVTEPLAKMSDDEIYALPPDEG